MLQIMVPERELWNEEQLQFVHAKATVLQLEHSLVSVSKWESKWGKAFLGSKEKTREETIDYIKCMTITQNVPPEVYECLTTENLEAIKKYIGSDMTATKFYEDAVPKRNREAVTSELIYYWMVSYNIPMECQKWHLNRLLTFIRLCDLKNQPPKHTNRREQAQRYARINEERRRLWNTRG